LLLTLLGLFALSMAASSCQRAAPPEPAEPVATAASAIGDGEVDEIGKYNSVVQVDVQGRGACSGTLVTPFYVLTANHCVTGELAQWYECPAAKGFTGQDVNVGADINFFVSGNNFYSSSHFCFDPTGKNCPPQSAIHSLAGSGEPILVRTVNEVDNCTQEGAKADIALIRLDTRVSTNDFAPLHPPILNVPTLTFSPSCMAGLDPDDFTARDVGYGKTIVGFTTSGGIKFISGNDDRLRTMQISDDWYHENGVIRNEYSVFSTYQGTLYGDSGGPLFSTLLGEHALCGVNSRFGLTFDLDPKMYSESADLESSENQAFLRAHLLDVSETHFVGECNANDAFNNWSNPAFQNTLEGDADSMPDACDPCPFQTSSDPLRGDFGWSMHDEDGDGVPEECDNCPKSLCDARGLPSTYCYNPYPANPVVGQLTTTGAQPDADGDGVGDACDSCPMVPNQWSQNVYDDPDNDLVGSACDNCDQRNAVRACQNDADCTYTTTAGQVMDGFCIGLGHYGRCDDDEGWACFGLSGNKDCHEGVQCLGPTSFGRCSQQVDDHNDNGVGGVCDACDEVPGATIQANSNRIREDIEIGDGLSPEKLGDACDPVPVYASRAVTALYNTPDVQAYDPNERTRFTSTAGIGRDVDLGYAPPPVQAFTLGFRWCNCHNFDEPDPNKQDLSLDDCVKKWVCDKNPDTGYTPPPNQQSSWVHVSTQNYPWVNSWSAGSFPGSGSDQEIVRAFTTNVSLDPLMHNGGESETNRIGLIENLFWDQAVDIAAGTVPSFIEPTDPQKLVRTTGAFWSHVKDDGATYASARDFDYYTPAKGTTHEGLRDHYYRVRTPDTGFYFEKLLTCDNGGCFTQWRKDLLTSPALTITSPVEASLPTVALISCAGGCLAVGPYRGTVDLSQAIQPAFAQTLQDPTLTFMSPVERGYEVTTAPSGPALMSIGMPRNFTASVLPLKVVSDGTAIFGEGRIIGTAALQSAPSGPPDRSDPRYAFSLKQSAIYMVGGTLASGVPAREIWRYDLIGKSWSPVLTAATVSPGDPAPYEVAAAGYDARRTQLAFVDFTTKKLNKAKSLSIARLVVVDTATRKATVALTVPRVKKFSRLFLAARGRGSWVLVGQVGTGPLWMAFQFELDAAGALTWTGWTLGQGRLIDTPINSSDGLFLPLGKAGQTEFARLEPDAFDHDGKALDQM
jgi:Trypsin